MWTLILIILALIIGIAGGYQAGIHFIKKENAILHKQIALLENYSTHWGNEAANKYNLVEKVSTQQQTNLGNTLHTVINILQTVQEQTGIQQKQQVNNLIEQAKQILPNTTNDTF